MRIADKMAYEQVNLNVAKNRSTMSELQNQAATQKRVTKPSDDPVAAARVLGNRVDLTGHKQYLKNLNYARSFLEYTDQSLADLSEVLVRAKELAIHQSSDASANAETRRVVATEIEQLYNQMVQIGNRKLGDRFVFGGYKTVHAPFDLEGRYKGDSGEMLIHIDKDSFMAMNIPGAKVFLGKGLSKDGGGGLSPEQPRTVEELIQQRVLDTQKELELRGPASEGVDGATVSEEQGGGLSLFQTLKNLEISLRVNDKDGVQESLDTIDQALNQVVLTRAQVGSRSMALDSALQSLERAKVDSQVAISQLEDADVFQTVSDINKTEATLQATLQTSGKLMQKSLLEFLR